MSELNKEALETAAKELWSQGIESLYPEFEKLEKAEHDNYVWGAEQVILTYLNHLKQQTKPALENQ
ncbi:hypothetical protein [Flexibacterium corallicola]|uniref:hypothetical protein n=1 Tax=Flexibacterium corallicola TaxID=3037259 RepID=UPI00286FAC4A|nr:hypothetical protein [Pseudovibrio sp. M1P-2-3]